MAGQIQQLLEQIEEFVDASIRSLQSMLAQKQREASQGAAVSDQPFRRPANSGRVPPMQMVSYCQLNTDVFSHVLNEIADLSMILDDDRDIKIALGLFKLLDQAHHDGHWGSGLFFRVMGQRLLEWRDKVKDELQQSQGIDVSCSHSQSVAPREFHGMPVYVLLFQSAGSDMQAWSKMLLSLNKHSVGRPIYVDEFAIKKVLKARSSRDTDGYAEVYIDSDDIDEVTSKNLPPDRLGQGVIALKMGAIKTENISRFVHVSGEYQLLDENLVEL